MITKQEVDQSAEWLQRLAMLTKETEGFGPNKNLHHVANGFAIAVCNADVKEFLPVIQILYQIGEQFGPIEMPDHISTSDLPDWG